MNELELVCGHRVQIDFDLKVPEPTAEHYVWCPSCRERKNHMPYHIPVDLTWTKVINVVPDVQSDAPRIMPNDVLRLRPNGPRNRVNPFPYVRGFNSDGRVKSRIAGVRNGR